MQFRLPLALCALFGDFLTSMIDFQTGMQNIADGQGVAVATAGMLIVFTALSLISVFIALLPRLLTGVGRIFPEKAAAAPRRSAPQEDLSLVAAAAAAFHAASIGSDPGA